MDELISLGQFIAARRKRMHLSQEQLAEKMNVSKSAIGKWETDGGLPGRDNFYKLAETLRVSVEALYRLVDSEGENLKQKELNITADIIAVLERYGYKVIQPNKHEGGDEDGIL